MKFSEPIETGNTKLNKGRSSIAFQFIRKFKDIITNRKRMTLHFRVLTKTDYFTKVVV